MPDKFYLPKIAVTGLILLAVTVIDASYAPNFEIFILAMALMEFCAERSSEQLTTRAEPGVLRDNEKIICLKN